MKSTFMAFAFKFHQGNLIIFMSAGLITNR